MKRFIFLFLVILLASFALASEVKASTDLSYYLSLAYQNGSLKVAELSLIEGKAPDRANQPESGYELKVVSSNDEVLYSFKFLISTEVLTAPPMDIFDENGNQIVVPQASERPPINDIVLIAPYFENAKAINIYDKTGQIVLSVDVTKYAKKNTGAGGGNWPNMDNSLTYLAVIVILIIVAIPLVLYFKKRFPKIGKNKTTQNATSAEKPKQEKQTEQNEKFCSNCGKPIEKKVKFCPNCGAKT